MYREKNSKIQKKGEKTALYLANLINVITKAQRKYFENKAIKKHL